MTRTAILLTIAAFAATASTARQKPPFDGRGAGPTIANKPATVDDGAQLSWLAKPLPKEWLNLPEPGECDPKACSTAPKTKESKSEEGWLKLPFPPNTPTDADRNVLPPLKYDRPYTGELVVMRIASQKDMTLMCPPTTFRLKACAQHTLTKRPDGSWTKCNILLPPDSVIIAAGYSVDAVYRHELGHCNGWGDEHKGARMWMP